VAVAVVVAVAEDLALARALETDADLVGCTVGVHLAGGVRLVVTARGESERSGEQAADHHPLEVHPFLLSGAALCRPFIPWARALPPDGSPPGLGQFA